MSHRPIPRQHAPTARRGFTLVELALTVTIIGLLTAMGMLRFNRVLQHVRIDRATATVAGDLESAFTLAGRQRRPIRIACTCGARTYTLADRTGGTLRLSRGLTSTDYGVATLTFNPATVDVFPSGVSTQALTVTISGGGWSRTITMSTAGQVRTP
jgi:prepilin-type N-terminal cleavage/methylation domain-containing protein